MKTPMKRAALSVVVLPGVGQYQNGQKAKALFFALAALIIVVGLVFQIFQIFSDYMRFLSQLAEPDFVTTPMEALKGFWMQLLKLFLLWGTAGIVVWTAAGVDAYRTAKKQAVAKKD